MEHTVRPLLVAAAVVTLLPIAHGEAEDVLPSIGSGAAGFDCLVGLEDCADSWSDKKKHWCLRQEGLQCPKHQEFGPVDTGVAWAFLGGVALVLALSWFLGSREEPLRRHSWSVLSASFSIFTAWLVAGSATELLLEFVSGPSSAATMAVHLLLVVAWSAALQAAIFAEGGGPELDREVWVVADPLRADFGAEVAEQQVRSPVGRRGVAVVDGIEVFVHKAKILSDQRDSRTSWRAMFLAHAAGCQTIMLGRAVQHLPAFRSSPAASAAAALAAPLLLLGLLNVTGLAGGCTGGAKDADDTAREARTEALGLSGSFLIVQALRLWICGSPTSSGGHGAPGLDSSLGCGAGLCAAGLALGAASFMLPAALEGPSAEKRRPALAGLTDVAQSQGAMVCAWSAFWSYRWQVARSQALEPVGGLDGVGGQTLLALGLSFGALAASLGLTRLEELAKSKGLRDERQLARLAQRAVSAIGVLVGFAWQQAFNGGLREAAGLAHRPLTVRFFLSACVAVVVLFTWQRCIHETVMLHQLRLKDELEVGPRPGGSDTDTGVYAQLEYEDHT